MTIARSILKFGDKLTEEAYAEEDSKKAGVKAFTAGALEGAIDAAVVCYPLLLAGCYYWKKQALKK